MSQDRYILTASDIAAMDGTRKTHFMNPNAQRINKSLGDCVGLTGIGIHLIEVAPGHDTTEHHLHYNEDECVFILSGTATALIGDEAFDIGAGDFIGYRKGGLAHSIKNTGTTVLRCLVAGERQSHDVCDYPHADKRLFRAAGLAWNIVDRSQITEPPRDTGKK